MSTAAKPTRFDALLRDAQAAGYTVTTDSVGGTGITRVVKTNKTGRRREGVYIFEDGWTIDVTVDLSCAKCFRGLAVRKVLGLPQEMKS